MHADSGFGTALSVKKIGASDEFEPMARATGFLPFGPKTKHSQYTYFSSRNGQTLIRSCRMLHYEIFHFEDHMPPIGSTKANSLLEASQVRLHSALDYVVAVEDGKIRPLTEEEDREFKRLRRFPPGTAS